MPESTITDLQGEVRTAFEEFETAKTAIDDAGEDADLDALEQSFSDAEERHKQATVKLEQAERVEDARAKLPVEPVQETPPEIKVGDESAVYEKYGDDSFFIDMYRAIKQGDSEARERLERHKRQLKAAPPREERTNPSTTAGQGGEFAPPLWMQSEWVAIARAGRPFASALTSRPLPGGVNTLNMPTVATGATTATQADAGAVSSTDVTTSSITVPIITIAGQQDMSQQLIDRSVPGFDTVVFDDLTRTYATNLDVQVLSGSGSSPNARGLLNVSGINTVTYTDASPAFGGSGKLHGAIANAIQKIHTTRYLPPNLIVMHPRRWGWILAADDADNRPLVTPYAPMNAGGLAERVASENLVGSIQGLPVLVDASVPTTGGASTNQDQVIVTRTDDLYLWEEGTPRTRLLEEVLSNTLQVRAQIYGYAAFTGARYPLATCVISGTGLVAPSF